MKSEEGFYSKQFEKDYAHLLPRDVIGIRFAMRDNVLHGMGYDQAKEKACKEFYEETFPGNSGLN